MPIPYVMGDPKVHTEPDTVATQVAPPRRRFPWESESDGDDEPANTRSRAIRTQQTLSRLDARLYGGSDPVAPAPASPRPGAPPPVIADDPDGTTDPDDTGGWEVAAFTNLRGERVTRSAEFHLGEEEEEISFTERVANWIPEWVRWFLVGALVFGLIVLWYLRTRPEPEAPPEAERAVCYNDLALTEAVPCADPHDYEVIGRVTYPAPADELAPYPTEAEFDAFADAECQVLYASTGAADAGFTLVVRVPTSTEWIDQSARDIACLVTHPLGRTAGPIGG